MNTRDLVFLVVGAMIGLTGIIGALLGSVKLGTVALMAMSVILLVLLVLQRRQLAKVQQRMLSILNAQQKSAESATAPNLSRAAAPQESIAIPTKKIVGLLQAQQISMEKLNAKLNRALPDETQETTSSQ